MKPKERRDAQIRPALDYELQYRNLRAEGLRALAQGRAKEAIDALGRAALFQSNDPVAHFDLGRALQLDGKTEAARQAYLRALDLNANLSDVKAALLALPPLPPTRQDFHVGQRIKAQGMAFRVLEVRRGGFGAVYVVIDEQSQARWALKTFQAKYLWSDADRTRFEREALTWLMLDPHPFVVTARGLMLIEGLPCLWLDYLPYNLAQVLRKKPVNPEIAVGLALQFCDGMFYAHQKMGIVHRDVKPSNCLLTEKAAVLKVTDFGLARTFAEAQEKSLELSGIDPQVMSQFTTVAGTPQYMSPEQFRAGAVLDTRSDIHSFGVMFYEMLTKDLPPVGFLAHSHIEECPVSENFPASLKEIILHCVQLDPQNRPKDFGELHNQLDAEYERLSGLPYPWRPIYEALEMDSRDWNDKGIGLADLGYLEEACTCGMRAVELSPNDATAWLNYGGTLWRLGRFNEALVCFEKGLKIDSSKPELWANKGLVLESLHRADEARACYERAIEIDPENDTLWMNLGANFADAGDLERSVSCYDRSLEINPRNFGVRSNKAKGLHALGRYEEALASCDEGLAINPRDPDLWNTRACVLLKLERFEEALLASNRGLEIEENKSSFWRTQGSILKAMGKTAEAEECFDRVKTLSEAQNRAQIDARVAELESDFDFNRTAKPQNASNWDKPSPTRRSRLEFDEAGHIKDPGPLWQMTKEDQEVLLGRQLDRKLSNEEMLAEADKLEQRAAEYEQLAQYIDSKLNSPPQEQRGRDRMTLVFQYGSNCLESEINSKDRLGGDAKFIEIAQTVDDFELAFDVWSNNRRCAAADIVKIAGSKVWGVIYEIPDYLIGREDAAGFRRKSFDEIEGEGTNYRRKMIQVRLLTSEVVSALTYVVRSPTPGLKTSLEYVSLIVKGLNEHKVPNEYVGRVKAIGAANNPAISEAIAKL